MPRTHKTPRPRIEAICQNAKCKKIFLVNPNELLRNHGKYCSVPCRALAKSISPEERFWSKVHITNSCWIWLGSKHKRGYGLFTISFNPSISCVAHRYAWELILGPIPQGLFLCHNCPEGDNPSCVNPAHLFLGTQKDNIQDASKKGRLRGRTVVRGEEHPMSKLTKEQVIQILASIGIRKAVDVAKENHCSPSLVSKIWNKQLWKHLHKSTVSLE